MTNSNLIQPVVNDLYSWEEQTPENFISREEFINCTGIFVTTSYFYHVYKSFLKSGLTVNQFLNSYEDMFSHELEEVSLSGKLKYHFTDTEISNLGNYEDDDYIPNIYDLLNSLACSLTSTKEHNEKIISQYKSVLSKAIRMCEEQIQMVEGEIAVKPSLQLPS